MKKVAALLLFALMSPSPASANDGIRTDIEPRTRKAILKPLEPRPPKKDGRSLFDKVLSSLVIPLERGPMLLLPVLDSSKDLGPNYGIMPIWALRDKSNQVIRSVMAPSVNRNRYLDNTYTYRHYIFPNDKKLIVVRGSYSERVQREAFFHYFNPEFMGTRFRINAEARHWVNGKASFYGYGPRSSKSSQASYALNMTGEEFTVDFPLPRDFYLDFTHSYYSYKVGRGPVTTIPQTSEAFPVEFAIASQEHKFINHRLALIFDDTDHPILPRIGTYASLSAQASMRALGSDFDYRVYSAELKHYYNYKEEGKYITAVHYLIQKQTGEDLPFYARSVMGESAGLRVAGDGRYVDKGKLLVSVEERIRLSRSPLLKFFSEIELAPFLDFGTVFSAPSAIRMDYLQFGPGMALRVVVRPQVVATADMAFGREGTNFIIRVGYPF